MRLNKVMDFTLSSEDAFYRMISSAAKRVIKRCNLDASLPVLVDGKKYNTDVMITPVEGDMVVFGNAQCLNYNRWDINEVIEIMEFDFTRMIEQEIILGEMSNDEVKSIIREHCPLTFEQDQLVIKENTPDQLVIEFINHYLYFGELIYQR